MKPWQIILCVLINAIWVIPLIYELVISTIKESIKLKKKNDEWIKINGRKMRKQCINCSYCKWFWQYAFGKYSSYSKLRIKTPSYCRKFKKSLSYDIKTICIAKDYEEAEYE